MTNPTPYPDQILALLKFDGFLAEFYRQLPKAKSNTEAYEQTEALYEKYYGSRKYADYNSFSQVRKRKLRRPPEIE
jgi:hypothetical protein